MSTELPPVIADYLRAVNAFDAEAIAATFADDALVNDNRREIRGHAAIEAFAAKELAGDRVTMEVVGVTDHYGDIVVEARYDGDYDKTNLPGDLIMSNYFSLRDGKIASLFVIRNQPSPY